ncbi:MAG: c-type cytochrome, partial [Gammaproteobacteria bacterium]
MTTLMLCLHGVAFAGSTAQTYADYCSVCHGEKGDGRSHAIRGLQPPPRDFTDPAAAHLLTRDYMTAIITNGKPGTAMAAWSSQLDGVQIAGLVDYIRSEFMPAPDERHATGQEAARVGSGIVSASQTDGKRIYDSTCSVCHGDDGVGAVWGQTSLNPPPVNFTVTDPVSQLTRGRMLASVTHGRPGTAMTAFGSQLSEDQIAAVVDYIRDAFM